MKVINFLGRRIGSGGIESFVTNVAEGMKGEDIEFIVCVNEENRNIYEQRLLDSGAQIVYLGANKGYIYNLVKLMKYTRNNKDAILHLHASTSGMYLHAFLAKITGLHNIVYHIHSTKNQKYSRIKKVKDIIVEFLFSQIPKERMACSDAAGNEFYKGKYEFTVAHNGIDVDRFRFSIEKRIKVRKKLGIEKEFVIIQVGRLAYPKNQCYSLKIINELRKINKNYRMLIIGEGTEKIFLDEYIEKNGLMDCVSILPPQANVEEYYMAADLMLFPSVFEGLGIVAIEAQAAGLPVICSENITTEAIITSFIQRIDLNDPDAWVKKIIEWTETVVDRDNLSAEGQMACKKNGYSIENTCSELMDTYNKMTY